MPNGFTNKGQELMLHGTSGDGSFTRLATSLRLFTGDSVPAKNGALGGAFVEVPNGNGYVTGGVSIVRADWALSLVGGNQRVTLATFSWTAVGGAINNVKGAMVLNAANEVLGWWERPSAVNLAIADVITCDGLYAEITG